MADVTSVGITSGIPSSGTGSVRTIGAMFLSSNIQYTGLSTANGANTVTLSSESPAVSAAGTPNSSYVFTVQLSTAPNSSAAVIYLSSNSPGVVGLGQTTMANSLPFTLASDSTSFTVTPSSTFTVIANLNPTTTGGLSVSSVVCSNTTNATTVKAAAGQVYKVEGFNVSTAVAFLKMYNLSTAPTAGSTTAFTIYTIPCSSQGAGLATEMTNGVAYGTGIGYTVTSSMTSSDTTALPTANAVTINVYYT